MGVRVPAGRATLASPSSMYVPTSFSLVGVLPAAGGHGGRTRRCRTGHRRAVCRDSASKAKATGGQSHPCRERNDRPSAKGPDAPALRIDSLLVAAFRGMHWPFGQRKHAVTLAKIPVNDRRTPPPEPVAIVRRVHTVAGLPRNSGALHQLLRVRRPPGPPCAATHHLFLGDSHSSSGPRHSSGAQPRGRATGDTR